MDFHQIVNESTTSGGVAAFTRTAIGGSTNPVTDPEVREKKRREHHGSLLHAVQDLLRQRRKTD